MELELILKENKEEGMKNDWYWIVNKIFISCWNNDWYISFRS
jgi:hypothetical protein